MIELDDLADKKAKTPSIPNAVRNDDNDGHVGDHPDGNYAIPSVVLLLVSALFIGSPSFVFYLASNLEPAATPLERFLLTHLGIYLSVVGISLLLRTSRHPLLIPLTVGSSLSAFLSYNTSNVGSLATLLFLSQLILSLWGSYSLLFGNEAPHLHRSKTTGADKRTSAFIFGNKTAASTQKKEWRKQEKAKGR